MKKLLIALSMIGVISLSSFTSSKTVGPKPVKEMTYYFHCSDGHGSGSITCYCSQSVAQYIANFICSF